MKIKLLLAALLASTPAAALAEWREAETAHSRIITEQNDKDLARFAHRLEAVNALMMKANGTKPPRRVNKVRVYVVPGLDDVERAIDAVGSGVAGFYTINEDGPLAVIPRRTGADYGTFTPELVLFHEYGHHFQLRHTHTLDPGRGACFNGALQGAIVQIGPLAFDPHKSPSRERALKRLEELKKAAAAKA